MTRTRHHFTSAERRAIFNADRIPLTNYALCRYCGKPLRYTDDWHIAHEISVANWPRLLAKFGRDSYGQVGVSCKPCNLEAGSRNMTILQRLSLRTWLWLILAFVIILALALIVIKI